ncbi:odorant receptor 67b-like [Harpegnathos saltator]|uniref:odorant receptor 67b-like n=1 Tax=Harpegnathos saltator TaxID=610380 RepID=UPI000DBEE79F|nr:odorant receptor 67b-like [Harpegnathos saltator]
MCLDVRKEMINIESQNFSLNRILLLAVGLWPYQRTKFVRFRVILFSSILMSSIIFQLTALIAEQLSAQLVIKVSGAVLFFSIFVIKFNSFWINLQSIKCLMEQLQRICDELKDKNEIAILEKYGRDAKRYTINILLVTVCSLAVIIVQPFWPYIYNVLPFMNGSRSCCTLPIVTEYFIDQEKYFYIIILHMDVAFCIGAIAMIGTGTWLVVSLKHACSIFKIASYRIELAIINIFFKNNMVDEITIYKRITYAVDIHCKAMQFAKNVITSFDSTFFFLIAVGVASLSFNLFRIFQILSSGNDMEEMILRLLSGIIIITYMFLANYAGQEITDHNNHVYFTAYNVCWYITPLHVQKLILFLLQRGSKTFSLTVGGLFTASLECFASLAGASVSYFTVMYSTQQ